MCKKNSNFAAVMKKSSLFILFLMTLTACNVSHEKFVVHETTPLYAAPDETSQIVGEQKFSDTEPVISKEVKDNFALIKRVKQDDVPVEYWLPLSDVNAVAPAGTTDKEEVSDILVVVPKKLTFYARPEVNKKKAIFNLSKGDTIRALGRHEGWVHAEVVQYQHSGKGKKEKDERVAAYGWVEESPANLEAAGQMTQHAYDRHALAKVNPKKATRLTYLEDMRSGKGLLDHAWMGKIWPICRILFIVSAVLALIWNILVFGKFTERADCDHTMLPIMFVVLVLSCFIKYPHWFVSILLLFACLMVLYPMLLTKAAIGFKWTYYLTTGALCLVYLLADFNANNYSGLDWLWHAFCFFILGCAVYGFMIGLCTRCDDHVCPHCSFYGNHIYQGSHETSSAARLEDNGYTDDYSHTEYHGGRQINYYNRTHHYRWVRDITKHMHYSCRNCGADFTTRTTRTVSA